MKFDEKYTLVIDKFITENELTLSDLEGVDINKLVDIQDLLEKYGDIKSEKTKESIEVLFDPSIDIDFDSLIEGLLPDELIINEEDGKKYIKFGFFEWKAL